MCLAVSDASLLKLTLVGRECGDTENHSSSSTRVVVRPTYR